jgi:hypothetical protein
MSQNLDLKSLSTDELFNKITDLQTKMRWVHSSGNAGLFNQMSATLNAYLTEFNNRKAKNSPE